jgi:hypothetical protein
VRHPKLIIDADGNLPHIHLDGSLCLHEPRQWSPGACVGCLCRGGDHRRG